MEDTKPKIIIGNKEAFSYQRWSYFNTSGWSWGTTGRNCIPLPMRAFCQKTILWRLSQGVWHLVNRQIFY